MLKKFFEAIGRLFSALFGGGDKKPVDTDKPKRGPAIEIIPELPQDGAEVKKDEVVESSEKPPIRIDPDLTDRDFDEELVEDSEEVDIPEPDPVMVDTPTDDTPTPIEPTHKPRFLWCLDNGHGSLQAGKRSPVFDDGETQFFEYEFNRDIVNRIIKKLDVIGVKYFNVVPEIEVDAFLKERVARANKVKSDLDKIFVSVHSNAGSADDAGWTAPGTSGIETWYYLNSSTGKKLAAVFQRHLVDELADWKNRKLKAAKGNQIYVLSATKMPAILTENGFFNNKAQALDLMKDEVRQKIADAHVAAILEVEDNGIK